MDLNKKIIELNHYFSTQGIKVRIERRGDKLNFRGPLPCRNKQQVIKSQRISLNLSADQEGLAEAQKLLQLLNLQLEHGQFNWRNWSKETKEVRKETKKSIDDMTENFEVFFFENKVKNRLESSAKTTWNSAYKPYLRRLIKVSKEKGLNVNKDLFKETLITYKEKSRSRQQCGTALNAFSRYLEIELPDEWKKLSSGYGLHNSHFRDLPNEKLIKDIWELIPNYSWKLVYGLMATYGLRNHEVFFSDLSSLNKNGDQIIRVLPNTKTGEHEVWPFHPEWVDFFKLNQLGKNPNLLPSINRDLQATTLQKVGRRVTEQFHRYKLPLRPYDLRHAWAIRTIHIGLPDTVAARMMGHSVAIHTKTYHHWINRRDQQKAVDNALKMSK